MEPASAGQKRARKLLAPKMANNIPVKTTYPGCGVITWKLPPPPLTKFSAWSAQLASRSVSGALPRFANRTTTASRKAVANKRCSKVRRLRFIGLRYFIDSQIALLKYRG